MSDLWYISKSILTNPFLFGIIFDFLAIYLWMLSMISHDFILSGLKEKER
jgi:hypothetical protein